jgi:hypothetical protein
VDGQHAGIKVEIMDPQFQALKQPQPAAIERLHEQVIGRIEVPNDGVDLFTRQDNGNIATSLCPDHVPKLAELIFKNMPEEKQQRIECLVLR